MSNHSNPPENTLNKSALKKTLGLVLAGGQSSRMGENKALLNYQGQSLLELACINMATQVEHVAISCGRHNFKNIDQNNAAWINKYFQLTDSGTLGPAGGIDKGLEYAKQLGLNWCAVCPCDTPRLPKNWLNTLIMQANNQQAQTESSKATLCHVPLYVRFHGRDHYAHSIWPTHALPKIKELIEPLTQQTTRTKGLSLRKTLAELNGIAIDLSDYWQKDAFANINTPEEFQQLTGSKP